MRDKASFEGVEDGSDLQDQIPVVRRSRVWTGRAPLAAGGTATADYNCEPGRGRSKLNDENVDFLFDVSNFL